MKKNIILLLVILLVVGVYFFLNKNTKTTLIEAETSFAVENTDEITKIFLSKNVSKTFVLLEKKDGKWLVNNKFEAQQDKIDVLLQTIGKLEVKHPVADKALDYVLKDLIVSGTKVEIYTNNRLNKTYFVGDNTPDMMGTYMCIQDAKRPYVVHIPGFDGYLQTRYFINEKEWKSKMLFQLKSEQIAEVSLQYANPEKVSFTIQNENNATITPLVAIKGETNNNKILSYLNLFSNLEYEGYPLGLTPSAVDSIYNMRPWLLLTLKEKSGKITTLKIYPKKQNRTADMQGNPIELDMEYYYAFVNDSKEIIQLQEYHFGKIFKGYVDFMMD